MNIIERRYRIQNVIEDLTHLSTKVSKVKRATRQGPETDRMVSAEWHLKRAAEMLGGVLCPSTQQDLTHILEVSLAGIREKHLCEEVGREVLPTNEKRAHAENVSPFQNRHVTSFGE